MKYIHFLYIGLLSLLFVGCQEEQLNNMQTGGFLISLNDDVSTEVTTKSTPAELGEPATENFKLKIVNETTNDPLYDGAYKSGPIPASAGSYAVTASFGDNSLVALDEPYYKGEETGVVVEEGKTTSVLLACKVANALASVVFPDATEMAKIYESYWVKVVVENYNVKLKPNSTNSAYFQVGKEVSFYFEGEKLNGQSVSAKLEHDDLPTTFEAADHYTLTLTFNDDLTLDISKVEATTVKINETIPMEWLPRPKVEAEGFIDDTLTFVETETPEASIKLSTASALQDMRLKFHFEDPQFEALNRDTGYLYSNPADKDLINTTLGISLSDENKIDLSSLLDTLQTNAGEVTTNTIEIDVKANNRWSSEEIEGQETPNLKYTLKCEKPEFTVSAYPGNIWTKEFTMNALMEDQVTKGDFSKLSENMKYQFSTNGESDWIDLGKDLRKDGLTPGRTYYIRGVYRGEVCSDPVAVSTYPIIELENGGLEGSSIVKGEDKNSSEYGAVYAWNGWSTLNELTCDKCTIILFSWGNTAFNSRSGTRPSSIVPEGSTGSSSAWIMTMGYGYGGWSGPESYTPSELFLGSYSNGKNYGIQFSSRPGKLDFYYKYYPYNNDKSDIYIQIKGKNGELLGSASLNEANTVDQFSKVSLEIKYDETYKDIEPETLIIVFKSGFNTDVKDYGTGSKMGNNSAEPSHRGSELYIDDISLVYDK